MNLAEARKILGLGPEDDPRPHLEEFKAARERIAEMVRTAPNEILGIRYQEGLQEFDKALAAIRDSLETPPPAAPKPPAEKAPASPAPTAGVSDLPLPRSRALASFAWFVVFLIGAAGGGYLYFKNEDAKELHRQHRLAFLERMGAEFVENRRWHEAASTYAEIEALAPGSELANAGRRNIEAGMAEEQNQFVGYWTGQAIAELDASRLDEAQAAIQKVLERFPAEEESTVILERIAAARASQSRDAALAAARTFLDENKPQEAIAAAQKLLATSPDDSDARSIIDAANTLLEKQAADLEKAMSLYRQAVARDRGEFDQQALDWLREAVSLAPGHTGIAARLEKMASYTRTIRVPGDFATPAEALDAARDRDRIVLAEQTWKGPLIVNAAVHLQGAGSARTIVECPATDGSAITIGPEAKGARITGISFRHESFLMTGSDRFSVALVRGGGATFSDCAFSDASGHGLAVIESGEAVANRCRFSGNGWNGAAAIGKGARLEVRDSEASGNFEHGIETWDGATAVIVKNRCEGNSRNGIHADNGEAPATIEGNQLIGNREFGLVLDSAGSGKVSANIARANLLGGFVIRTAAAKVPVTGNQATHNQGPGIVLETGLDPAAYTTNTAAQNKGQQLVTGANLSGQAENPAE